MLPADIRDRFEAALRSDSLHDLTRAFIEEGLSQAEIYYRYEHVLQLADEAQREPDRDKLADEMDFIIGWCSAHMRWFEHYLTNEEIDRYRQERATLDQRG